ncbi:MAG: putative HTH-type transcriptional regulator [Elusimicrobia bacterium]|nr:putative HTH-type transcriptional regulator [Elusimicrobiota bacterium]
MIFSKTGRYVIRALAYMAGQPSGTPLDIQKIAKGVHAPVAYLAKVFQGLTRGGLVTSQRGQGGGYLLSKDPAEINLLHVMDATDDAKNSVLSNCVMGMEECSNKNPCTLHDIWVASAKKMKNELEKTTLQDVTGIMRKLRSERMGRRILSRRIRSVFK